MRTFTAYKEYVAYRQRENNPLAFKELEELISNWQRHAGTPERKQPLGTLH